MSAAKNDLVDSFTLTASIIARRATWASSDPSEAEARALERLAPTKGDSREEASAKAEAAEEWKLFRSKAKPGHPSFDPDRLLSFVIWSYEFAAIHDSDKDPFKSLKAFNAELRVAAGLLFEFFLERSNLDRASLWELGKAKKPDDPRIHGHEAVGAYKMEWILQHFSADLLIDDWRAAELPRPPAAYKPDGKARVFEHRLAGFLDRTCGGPSHRLVLAISRALYPKATPISDTDLYKRRSGEKTSRLEQRAQADDQTDATLLEWDGEPDVTHHSWYGKPPDTRQVERKVQKHAGYRRLVERVSIELRNAEREAEQFEKAHEIRGGNMAASRAVTAPRRRKPVNTPSPLARGARQV